MATVGNLFLNIGGSAKGLQGAVKSAKSAMNDYGRSSRRSVEHEKARLRNRQADVKKFQSQSQQSNSFLLARGIEPPAGASQQLARLQGREKSQHRKVRRAEHAEVRDRLAKAQREAESNEKTKARSRVAMVASVMGISVAAITTTFAAVAVQAKRAKAGADKFRFVGPSGGAIAMAEVQTMMQQMAAAQRPGFSSVQLQKAEAERRGQSAALAPGGIVETYNKAQGLFEDIRSAMTQQVSLLTRLVTGETTLAEYRLDRATMRYTGESSITRGY